MNDVHFIATNVNRTKLFTATQGINYREISYGMLASVACYFLYRIRTSRRQGCGLGLDISDSRPVGPGLKGLNHIPASPAIGLICSCLCWQRQPKTNRMI